MSFTPFSVNKTRNGLRDDSISQKEEMRYWFASSIVWLFYLYHSGFVGLHFNWFLVYDVLAAVIILWVGLSEALKANGGNDGHQFLRRVVTLGTPLGFTVLIASQILYWLGWYIFPFILNAGSFREPAFAWQIVNFVIFNGIQVWFWWRIHRHLTILQKHNI